MKDPLIIISAPSGAGKSSFVERVVRDMPDRLGDTVTFTTRNMRAGESEGNPYHFVSLERFQNLVAEGFFVEWAEVHGNYYGTPRHQLVDIWKAGKAVIMDVDVKGADTFKREYPDAIRIFIVPPSIDELRRRISKRDKKVPDDIDLRMNNAVEEMKRAPDFEYQVVNDEFEKSYAEFKKIIEALLATD